MFIHISHLTLCTYYYYICSFWSRAWLLIICTCIGIVKLRSLLSKSCTILSNLLCSDAVIITSKNSKQCCCCDADVITVMQPRKIVSKCSAACARKILMFELCSWKFRLGKSYKMTKSARDLCTASRFFNGHYRDQRWLYTIFLSRWRNL